MPQNLGENCDEANCITTNITENVVRNPIRIDIKILATPTKRV
jgi:hypothetical protein